MTMKAIINGKRYDTKTAECVAEWTNGHYTRDFYYCSEDLYRTMKGNWFVHGEGGALSKYAKSYGNSWGGSEEIRALTLEEARDWLEARNEVDTLEKYFEETVEDA
jgi:hypothetical protein